MSILFTNG